MSNAIAKRDARDIALPGFMLTATGAIPTGKPSFEQWRAAMQFVTRVESGVQFWRGDLLRFGYATYGEMASQEDGDGLPAGKTLRNEKWVAERVPVSLRKDTLSYNHHALVAALEPSDQTRWLHTAESEGLSVADLRSAIREERIARTAKANPLPSDKYRVIYADPPWSYSDERMGTIAGGGAGAQYDTMTTDEICNLDIKSLALPDAVLFLWATAPLLLDAARVIEAWGFEYKTNIVWDKERGFNGHYTDVRHEHLLVATRGSCVPDISELFPSVIVEAKGKHSAKPLVFHGMIDAMYPSGRRIELFARGSRHKGWEVWGNEAEQAA